MDRATYEIMKPEDVGQEGTVLTLGPRSGKHGLRKRLEGLGYSIADGQTDEIYKRFIEMAERKKQIYDEDLHAIMQQLSAANASGIWRLDRLEVSIKTGCRAEAEVVLSNGNVTVTADGTGNGPVDAVVDAITRGINLPEVEVVQYGISNTTAGQDALGLATFRIRLGKRDVFGQASSLDVVEASAWAFLNAINSLSDSDGARAN
jgi:2-isopropylmalate synthase